MTKNYIKYIRSKVGHQNIFLNFAGVIVLDTNGAILLQKRTDTNKWGLPGGALELGESFASAAIREAKEETGLKIKITGLLGIYSSKKYAVHYANGDKCQPIVVMFYAKNVGGKLKSKKDKESLELKYFLKNRLPSITNKQHKDIIHDAFGQKKCVWK